MTHLYYNTEMEKLQEIYRNNRKNTTQNEYDRASARSEKMKSHQDIKQILPNLAHELLCNGTFEQWLRKNLQLIIQQVFNIEFCLMRSIFLDLGVAKKELHIKENHNRFIYTRYGKVKILFSRTVNPKYSNVVLKTIRNFFKGDIDRVFSALRTNGLTPNEINNISKKVYGTSHSATKIQCSLNSEVVEFTRFNEAKLKDVYEIIHVDSKFIKVDSSKSYKSAVMVVVGITRTGNKKILQMNDIDTESHNNVTTVLQILKSRGVKNPSLFISDSSYGITSAIESVYPQSDIQHCFFHAVMNFVNVGVNKEDKSNIKSHIRKIFDYADFENIHEYIENFINEFPEYAKTFCTMLSDEYLYTYMKYDKSLHKYLRTNNLLESINQKIDIHMSHSKYFNSFDHFGASLIKKVIEFNTKTTGEIAKEIIAKIKSPTNIDFETLHEYMASKKANSDSFKHLILNDAGTKKHYFIENYKFKNLRAQIEETALKIKTST